jgi:pSer/pThr/pTyr-binding forkhead associated (FHA) protein
MALLQRSIVVLCPILVAAIAWTARADAISAGLLDVLGALAGQVLALVAMAYQRAPVLWLALSALLVLPAIALVSLAAQRGRQSMSRHSALRAAERHAQAADPAEDPAGGGNTAAAADPSVPRSQGWLTVEGRPGGPVALAGDVIRIGRHGDNDIRIAEWSVHRHHAVIERTQAAAFVIADVSGKDGSGVRVNGARTERVQLSDGDVIELGRARLRFENAPV